jgi:hypothetical protein
MNGGLLRVAVSDAQRASRVVWNSEPRSGRRGSAMLVLAWARLQQRLELIRLPVHALRLSEGRWS